MSLESIAQEFGWSCVVGNDGSALLSGPPEGEPAFAPIVQVLPLSDEQRLDAEPMSTQVVLARSGDGDRTVLLDTYGDLATLHESRVVTTSAGPTLVTASCRPGATPSISDVLDAVVNEVTT